MACDYLQKELDLKNSSKPIWKIPFRYIVLGKDLIDKQKLFIDKLGQINLLKIMKDDTIKTNLETNLQ